MGYPAASPLRPTRRDVLTPPEPAEVATPARRERAGPHRATVPLRRPRGQRPGNACGPHLRTVPFASACHIAQRHGMRVSAGAGVDRCTVRRVFHKALRRGSAREAAFAHAPSRREQPSAQPSWRRGTCPRSPALRASGQAQTDARAGGCMMQRDACAAARAHKPARAPGTVPAASSASACGRRPAPQLRSARGGSSKRRCQHAAPRTRGAWRGSARRTLLLVVGLGRHGADG